MRVCRNVKLVFRLPGGGGAAGLLRGRTIVVSVLLYLPFFFPIPSARGSIPIWAMGPFGAGDLAVLYSPTIICVEE